MAAKSSKERGAAPKSLIGKLRKPLAPPTRVDEDERKYKRARELQRLRRSRD